MQTFDLGDQPRFSVTFQVSGIDTDPTTVKFKYRTPANVETELLYGTDVELVKDGTGQYHVDLLLDASGTWYVRWVGTGAAAAADEDTVRCAVSSFTDPL